MSFYSFSAQLYEQKLILSSGVFEMKNKSMRRSPQQARSQQRVDLILNTAADLFVKVGYESVTTNGIAERAGISIGSLYRYFPNKDAILHAVARRYLEQMGALYDEVFTEDAAYLSLPVLLDRLIDRFVSFHCVHPAYKHILLGSDISDDIAAASIELEEMTTERIKRLFLMSVPDLDEDRAHRLAVVSKAVVKALLSLITPSSGPEFQEQICAEIKQVLLAYLGPVFGDEAG